MYDFTIKVFAQVNGGKKTVLSFRTVFHITPIDCTKTLPEIQQKKMTALNSKTTLDLFQSVQSNSYALQASSIEYL